MKDSETTSRRHFLEKIFAATVMTVAAPSLVLGRIVPSLRESAGGSLAGRFRIDLSQPAYAALRTVGGSLRLARITGVPFRVIVTRTAESTFVAVNATCTHNGCTVNAATSASNGLLHCPCHDSRFEPDGTVSNGPATEPLARLETFFDGGDIVEIEIDGLSSAPEESLAGAHAGTPYVDDDGSHVRLDLALERPAGVHATIHDASGATVATVFDATLDAGPHELRAAIGGLASGMYLFRVAIEGRSLISRRFLVTR